MGDFREEILDHPLPPPLLRGPQLFNAWSQKRLLNVEQRAATPSSPLYHYTGEAALRGILQHQRPWCFSHKHQSDPNEFEYALRLARQQLQQGMTRKDYFERTLCGCLEDALRLKGLASPFDFYLFSLSRHRDDLGQWDSYGDARRGFSIGFGVPLLQPIQSTLNERANENLHLGRVLYGDDQILARHRLVIDKACEITRRIGQKNHDWLRTFRPYPFIHAMAQEVLASQLIWNCLTGKGKKYEPEQEVRGIVMGVSDRFDSFRFTLADPRRGDRCYIEHPMNLMGVGHIAEILVGPLAPSGAEDMVRTLLRDEGYPTDIPVIRSRVA
jgi:hypothetical protein